MLVNTLKLSGQQLDDIFPSLEPRPKQLFWRGLAPDSIINRPKAAIVGSRKVTVYGRTVTQQLATSLAESGVVIISGLAFGVDYYAHRAALAVNGCAVAVLPSPLNRIAPASHTQLANQLVRAGGALLSEYPDGAGIYKQNFIVRNRIVAALCDVLIITEAARNSGSLHTARFALEQGKTVMAVPGNINSPASEGCNNLIKSGAVPVTSVDDIFFALNLQPRGKKTAKVPSGSPQQQKLFELIADGISAQEELVNAAKMAPAEVSSILTSLELGGYIRPAGAGHWTAG